MNPPCVSEVPTWNIILTTSSGDVIDLEPTPAKPPDMKFCQNDKRVSFLPMLLQYLRNEKKLTQQNLMNGF